MTSPKTGATTTGSVLRAEPTAGSWQEAFDERCQAAEELSWLGHPSESLLLYCSAFEELTRVDRVPEDVVAAVRGALERAEALSPGVGGRGDGAGLAAWLESARSLSARAITNHAIEAGPGRRGGFAMALGLLLLFAATFVFIVKAMRPVPWASAQYADEYGASMAMDDDLTTEWLLPDQSLGHLDLALPRPRVVRAVVLYNGHNRDHLDRAVRDARVTIVDDDRVVDSAELHFDRIDSNVSTRTARLHGKKGTRVRIEVLAHFGTGAALSEVAIQ
jgi:hypothetical protein